MAFDNIIMNWRLPSGTVLLEIVCLSEVIGMRAYIFVVTLVVSCSLVYSQDDPITEGEMVYSDAETKDKEYDQTIIYEGVNPPAEKPEDSKVDALYKEQQGRVFEDAFAENISRSVFPSGTVTSSLDVKFFLPAEYLVFQYGCCPRTQNYCCRSFARRLPCFFDFKFHAWCCPFYPTSYIYSCNCNKCAIFNGDCVAIGYCRRRYALRAYYAICYHNFWWSFIKLYYQYTPTSCYCQATCS